MRTLPGMGIEPLERHVLGCPLCLERLAETIGFVTAMRAAAAECERQQGYPRLPGRHGPSRVSGRPIVFEEG